MNTTQNVNELKDAADRRKAFNDAKRREKAKTTRDVQAMYDAILRAGGFQPVERRAAWAVDSVLWYSDRQDYDAPQPLALSIIGQSLTHKSETKEAAEKSARNRVGSLFNHAIPRTGYQILTRYKAGEDEGRPHDYASHVLPVAVFFNELLDEHKWLILSSNEEKKQARIAEMRERLAAEALEYLPKCDTELLDEAGDLYAYVSAAEAQAYCKQKKGCSTRPLQYSEPEPDEKPKKPFYADDFDRLKKRAVKEAVDLILDAIKKRNGKDTAAAFWNRELLPALLHAGERWVNYRHVGDDDDDDDEAEEEEREEELNHGTEKGGVGADEPAETGASATGEPLPSREGSGSVSANENNDLKNGLLHTPNFDGVLEAALFYAKNGFPVLPVCQWDTDAGRCTWAKHSSTCTGRKPLVAGDGSGGYSAATLGLEQISEWFTGEYLDQGVALRTDGKIVIDADVKDGGLESYAILQDTFSLEETLSAITQGGGRHFVFALPEGLPAGWVKSWVRVGNKVGLPGIDLKVHTGGLLFVEPTRGPKGVYRWIDLTAPIATLPRKCCDFLHEARYTETPEQKAKAARASARVYSSTPRGPLDVDQSKCFRDVPEGDRHKRILTVGVAYRIETGANADQVADVMRYHAGRFSSPLNDEAYIRRTSAQIARVY